MADICVIYAREDASEIPPALEAALGDVWSVWWDKKIVSGDYRKAIESQLPIAGCVVPIWSREAPNSSTLHDEVKIAIDAGIPVLPIRIHDVKAPLGYGVQQATDMLGWKGEVGRAELNDFKIRVATTLGTRGGSKKHIITLGDG